MNPAVPIIGTFLSLMGRILLAISIYFIGKGLWLNYRIRRRKKNEK